MRGAPAGSAPKEVESAIRRASCIQLDTISTVERSHRIAIGSRAGLYPRGVVPELLREGRIIEGWVHALCIVPAQDWPLHAWAREDRTTDTRDACPPSRRDRESPDHRVRKPRRVRRLVGDVCGQEAPRLLAEAALAEARQLPGGLDVGFDLDFCRAVRPAEREARVDVERQPGGDTLAADSHVLIRFRVEYFEPAFEFELDRPGPRLEHARVAGLGLLQRGPAPALGLRFRLGEGRKNVVRRPVCMDRLLHVHQCDPFPASIAASTRSGVIGTSLTRPPNGSSASLIAASSAAGTAM